MRNSPAKLPRNNLKRNDAPENAHPMRDPHGAPCAQAAQPSGGPRLAFRAHAEPTQCRNTWPYTNVATHDRTIRNQWRNTWAHPTLWRTNWVAPLAHPRWRSSPNPVAVIRDVHKPEPDASYERKGATRAERCGIDAMGEKGATSVSSERPRMTGQHHASASWLCISASNAPPSRA